jgi:hypothetical protein
MWQNDKDFVAFLDQANPDEVLTDDELDLMYAARVAG